MKVIHPVGLLLIGVLLLVFGGCASVSVTSERSDQTRAPHRCPTVLYVKDFGFPSQASIRADRQGAQLVAFEQGIQTRMRTQTVRALGRYGLPVVPVTAPVELNKLRRRQPGWLIAGQFTRVNQGSRALRIALGFGAGGTKMETAVQVYDLAERRRERPLFSFSSSGGSNAEPGVITSVGPLAPTTVPAAVIAIAGKAGHGVSEDEKRTARVIAAKVSEELSSRGCLPPEHKPGKAKRPGDL
ncbi:MAG: DUF4410 domain-containing protein [Verrucomicrobia bacterium]|nr:DUF4410 domain-containing protein [Verrucomicrobiota bacterium]